MKITIEGHEIVDARISKISLVKHGAIRAPFKIVKFDYVAPSYAPAGERKGEGGNHSGNPTVIPHREPDNGGVDRGQNVSGKYPLGAPTNPLNIRKDHSFDAMFRDASRRRRGGW